MYELQNINSDLLKKFDNAIFKAVQKNNWDSIISLSVKSTFHEIFPNFPNFEIEKYVKHQITPILERKKNNFVVREFENESERKSIFENTCSELIDELQDSQLAEDIHSLEVIYSIYDLLEYDKAIIIDGEKYLYSFIYISSYSQMHLEAYEKLKSSYDNKPTEKNINISTNSSKSIKDRINFLNPMLRLPIQNNHADNKAEKLKLGFIDNYVNDYRIMARGIHELSKLKNHSDSFEINTIGSLEPYVDSDGKITYHDLYISWYAYVSTIYKNITTTDKLKLARLSSYVIFPNLRGNEESIVKPKTAIKPIREIAFYKGLRLLEFTNNQTKIKKTDEEIEFTEKYLTLVTTYLNKYS